MSAFTEKIVDAVRKNILDDILRANLNTNGEIFWVLEDSDTDFNKIQQRYPGNVFTTVLAAYNACTTNRNDVILISGNTGHTISAMLTVSKSRVHFVGLGAGKTTQDFTTRLVMGVTTAVTDVALIRVTGTRCSFKNIKFQNENTLTESITCVQDEGANGSYWENCQIHSTGSAQCAATTGSALRLASNGAVFKNCQIGADTIANSVANQVVYIKTINSKIATRVLFEDCNFYTYATDTTHVFVKATAAGDVDRYIIFKNCNFFNFFEDGGAGSGTVMAVAFQSNLTSGGHIYVTGGSAFGVTDFATSAVGNGLMRVNMVVPTAGTSGIGVAPTA